MTHSQESHDRAHFQSIYDSNMDPWNYHTSEYEGAKRDATIVALEGRRFVSAIEIGCSIGALTQRLADCCDRLLAVDFIENALTAARAACAGKPDVTFLNARIPDTWPSGEFDLIVLSEVLYFLSTEDNLVLARHCRASLVPNGQILLVNWLGKSPDDPCSGDAAAKRFISATASFMHVTLRLRTDAFRLDKLERRT